jgi:chromosomal replication initiation ATPase DnaA
VRDQVADRFDVCPTALCGKSQSRSVSRARKVLAKICQQQGLKGSEIGNFLGRTRAAVSYMILSLDKDLERSPELRQVVEELQ